MNFANVRSAIFAMLALWFLGAAAASARAQDDAPSPGRVVIAILPYGTTVEEIAELSEFAPGLVSAGLGAVPVAQTFLDVGQGNRVNQTLYDGDLPRLYLRAGRVPRRLWDRTVERAEGAPADVTPGLLASTLLDAGIPVTAEANSGLATLIAVNRFGVVRIAERCGAGCGPGFTVMRTRVAELPAIRASLADGDLLIAVAAGARAEQQLLPIGIAGPDYHGDLTSASTRTDGVVTTADIAPTVLEAFGVDVPSEMNGSEITSGDERDPARLGDLQEKLQTRPSREVVALLPLGVWLALCALAAALWRRRGARVALRLLGVACAIAPLLMLLAAAFDTSTLVSALLLGFGSVAVAAGLLRVLAPYAALALACGLTVAAYAIDVVAGSPLTSLSVLGPNPGYGVRFFGIGNELEAILTVLTLIGTGSWLAWRQGVDGRAGAAWFLAIAALATLAFAPGRFGADVGAAIVLGVGGATAAVLSLRLQGRTAIVLVAGGGIAALAALLALDAILGGAHLSRSVLGAGEASDVLDVLDRRVTLMADTFIHPVYPELLAAAALLLVVGLVRRDTVLGWFGRHWAARAGFLGAVAGVLVGTVANDSGSVLLVLGTIYISVAAGFFWATRQDTG
ncbi:MAG TPA: hypothetical protein VHF58_10150 [Solirubrobacterales bacterium]|nr:hypothetical protein [Solirubrobacterales bacterium]